MAEDSRDVLMKMMMSGKAIPAECQAAVDKADKLADGFTSASGGSSANFFALQDFQMELGLVAEGETNTDPETAKQMKQMQDANQKQFNQLWQANKMLASAALPKGSSGEKYIRFMSRGRRALKSKAYNADLEAVTINRAMDASSLTLFKACKEKTAIDSAVVIKRRGGGGATLRTYLRIEFTSLLITDFSWSEDDVVKETIKFVCRKAQTKYSIETDAGTLKTPGAPGVWSMLG